MSEARDWLEEMSDDFLVADGFDDAIIAVTHYQPGRQPLVVYDAVKCVEILMERDGMDEEEAWEFFEYNVTGAWHGEMTPVFVTLCPYE